MHELLPTAFHRRLRHTLAAQEPGLFRWYESDEYETDRADRLRLELLRASYRLSPESHERPHRLARDAAQKLGLDVPIVLYQLHHGERANAGMCFMPGEAHILLSGPLLAALTDAELTALFGHELAHHQLFTIDDGAYRTAAEVIEASAAHAAAPPAFVEAARRHRRWTEIFADRGAAIAAGAVAPAIACLVKLGTALDQVSVADYLAQAHEIVERLGERHDAPGDSHPENAIRAIALELWHTKGAAADDEIAALVEGTTALETLDVVQQHDLAVVTRRLLDRVLAPPWMRTEATLAHARTYFPDYTWSAPAEAPLATWDLDEYVAYVLLDFAVIDPSLDEAALARVLAVAAELDVRDAVVAIARKELKLTASAITQLEHRSPALFEKIAQQGEDES